jgi:mono/diheme cytochrome c family protein
VSKRPFVLFGLLALICVIVLPILALGKETSPNTGAVQIASRDTDAKDLFNNNCGQCHTLEAAGSDGVVGPNLDDILLTGGINSAQTFDSIYPRVIQAVTCGINGRMPKSILLGENVQEVAKFVAAYAGQVGAGPTVNTDTVKLPDTQPTCTAGASG